MILRPSITFSHVSFSFIPTGLRWQHGALKLSVFICCYKNKPVTSIMRMSPGVAWALTSQTHCWRTHVAQKKQTGNPITTTTGNDGTICSYFSRSHANGLSASPTSLSWSHFQIFQYVFLYAHCFLIFMFWHYRGSSKKLIVLEVMVLS